MYGNTSIWQDLKHEFSKGNILTRLIFLNVALWIFLNLGSFFFRLVFQSPEWLAFFLSIFQLPSDISQLVFRPWTLITHMFAHLGLFHILFNMLWLYWMGRILREYLGDRKILPLYIYGGLSGAFFFILLVNLIPGLPLLPALGASAAVMAVVVATAVLLPDYQIFLIIIGPVKLKWIAFIFVVLDLTIGLNSANAGGSIAHLGGAFFGWFFIRQLQNGNDLSLGFNRFADRLSGLFVSQKGPKVYYRNPSRPTVQKPAKDAPQKDKSQQDRIDEILDKIARSGYDSLSQEEKDFLFRVSKEK